MLEQRRAGSTRKLVKVGRVLCKISSSFIR